MLAGDRIGYMDGSGSALAPLFTTAFTTRDPHAAFLVGLAAVVGAGNQHWVL
jgi:hypothetical protein